MLDLILTILYAYTVWTAGPLIKALSLLDFSSPWELFALFALSQAASGVFSTGELLLGFDLDLSKAIRFEEWRIDQYLGIFFPGVNVTAFGLLLALFQSDVSPEESKRTKGIALLGILLMGLISFGVAVYQLFLGDWLDLLKSALGVLLQGLAQPIEIISIIVQATKKGSNFTFDDLIASLSPFPGMELTMLVAALVNLLMTGWDYVNSFYDSPLQVLTDPWFWMVGAVKTVVEPQTFWPFTIGTVFVEMTSHVLTTYDRIVGDFLWKDNLFANTLKALGLPGPQYLGYGVYNVLMGLNFLTQLAATVGIYVAATGVMTASQEDLGAVLLSSLKTTCKVLLQPMNLISLVGSLGLPAGILIVTYSGS